MDADPLTWPCLVVCRAMARTAGRALRLALSEIWAIGRCRIFSTSRMASGVAKMMQPEQTNLRFDGICPHACGLL